MASYPMSTLAVSMLQQSLYSIFHNSWQRPSLQPLDGDAPLLHVRESPSDDVLDGELLKLLRITPPKIHAAVWRDAHNMLAPTIEPSPHNSTTLYLQDRGRDGKQIWSIPCLRAHELGELLADVKAVGAKVGWKPRGVRRRVNGPAASVDVRPRVDGRTPPMSRAGGRLDVGPARQPALDRLARPRPARHRRRRALSRRQHRRRVRRP